MSQTYKALVRALPAQMCSISPEKQHTFHGVLKEKLNATRISHIKVKNRRNRLNVGGQDLDYASGGKINNHHATVIATDGQNPFRYIFTDVDTVYPGQSQKLFP
uniref:DNA-directed DNA polymerase n=1 Tax=Romanomermis culicivorax TaxID=13658 RepID=A0A915L4J4_ROMCU